VVTVHILVLFVRTGDEVHRSLGPGTHQFPIRPLNENGIPFVAINPLFGKHLDGSAPYPQTAEQADGSEPIEEAIAECPRQTHSHIVHLAVRASIESLTLDASP
jgi:hypothetical protein